MLRLLTCASHGFGAQHGPGARPEVSAEVGWRLRQGRAQAAPGTLQHGPPKRDGEWLMGTEGDRGEPMVDGSLLDGQF